MLRLTAKHWAMCKESCEKVGGKMEEPGVSKMSTRTPAEPTNQGLEELV